MDLYLGTKLIQARPMTRAEYTTYRGWTLPDDEDGADTGMLVEYIDGGKGNHPAHSGYISWSPTEVFEKSYRPCEGLCFSDALHALKTGMKVARQGWNGKGMWLVLVDAVAEDAPVSGKAGYQAHGEGLYMLKRLPWIGMRTADMCFVPWLASQSDMLAEDWAIVKED
jgi:hypothetical protein